MFSREEIRHKLSVTFPGLILFFCLIFAVGAAHADNPPELNPIGDKSFTVGVINGFTITSVDPTGVEYDFYLAVDVNLDTTVSPLDVLYVINKLNNGSGLNSQDPDWQPELDVNGDGIISPIDVLFIINALNNGLTARPAGATLNRSSGDFSWQPTIEQAGSYRLIFVASRGDARDLERIIITVNLPAADTTPPTGSININSNAQYSNSQWVTLSLQAQDDQGGSGLSQMQFSNDNINWSAPESFALFKSWQLASGDSQKTVYVRYSDVAGNWSSAYSDTIVLDESAPSTPLVTDDGQTTVSKDALHSRWSSSDNTSGITEYQYRIIENSTSGSVIVDWTSVSTATEVTKSGLSLENGKTYYFGVKAKNGAELWSDIGYSDGIEAVFTTQDTTPPSGSIRILNNAEYALSRRVVLYLQASDNAGGSGMHQMQFSNDNLNWSTPQDYRRNAPWDLAAGSDGLRTAYARYGDLAGNWSSSYSDTIFLDSTPPSIPVVTDDGDTTGSSNSLHCRWSSTDEGSGIFLYQYKITRDSIYGPMVVDWTSVNTDTEITRTGLNLSDNVVYYFSVRAQDNAGFYSNIGYSDGIRVDSTPQDTTPPTGSIQINNGAVYTGFIQVTLNLTAQDNPGGSGLDKMQFSNDNINWSTPENYATTRNWDLSSGDNNKTVYVKYSDVAGNWSAAYSDAIILDTTDPIVTITSPSDGDVIQ